MRSFLLDATGNVTTPYWSANSTTIIVAMTGGDAAVADAFQAGRIPQEISVAYLDEDRDTPSMAASIAMFVLTLVVVNGRAFSRFFLRKSFGVDDALAVIGMVRTTSRW